MVKKKRETSDTSYNGVLIEDLHHKMDTVIEGLSLFDNRLRQVDEKFGTEIHLVKAGLQMVAEDVRKQREELKEFRSETHQGLEDLYKKFEDLRQEYFM